MPGREYVFSTWVEILWGVMIWNQTQSSDKNNKGALQQALYPGWTGDAPVKWLRASSEAVGDWCSNLI